MDSEQGGIKVTDISFGVCAARIEVSHLGLRHKASACGVHGFCPYLLCL